MKNKNMLIGVLILGVILIIGFSIISNKNKTSIYTRGGKFNKDIEVTFNNDSEYKNIKIDIETKSDKELPIKISLNNPKEEEKIINTTTNIKEIESFAGIKGEWKLKIETNEDVEVDYLVNFEGKNK